MSSIQVEKPAPPAASVTACQEQPARRQHAKLMVIKSWERGMSPEDIADFVEVPLEKVQAILSELTQPSASEEEE